MVVQVFRRVTEGLASESKELDVAKARLHAFLNIRPRVRLQSAWKP